ncbi:MAG: hypothetical protein H7838_12220 [Magnetococcus sp. DMHC-8]
MDQTDRFIAQAVRAQRGRLPRFRRRVGIQITTRCSVGCGHCIWDCTGRGHDMPGAMLSDCLRQWRALDGAEEVGITGGEPFSRPALLAAAVTEAAALGLKATVATSAVWATTPVVARRRLAALPGLDLIAISVDRFHLARVAPAAIANAVRAARALGIGVRLMLVVSDPDLRPDLAGLEPYLFADIAPEWVILAGLLDAGRARAATPAPPDGAGAVCGGLDVPLVSTDGSVSVCCAYSARGRRLAPFSRPGLAEAPLAKSLAEDDATYWIIHALRAGGPDLLVRLAGAAQPIRRQDEPICAFCARFFSDSASVVRAREAMAEQAVREEIAKVLCTTRGDVEPLARFVVELKPHPAWDT